MKKFFLRGCLCEIGNPVACLFLYLTGVHCRQHFGDVSEQKLSFDQPELEKEVVSDAKINAKI